MRKKSIEREYFWKRIFIHKFPRNLSYILKQSSLILVIMDLHSFWIRVEGDKFNL